MSTDSKTISKLNEMRSKAFMHCLTCVDNSCNLKSWDQANKKNAFLCKQLFFKANKLPKFGERRARDFLSHGYANLQFNFSINKEGLIEDSKITYSNGTIEKESTT